MDSHPGGKYKCVARVGHPFVEGGGLPGPQVRGTWGTHTVLVVPPIPQRTRNGWGTRSRYNFRRSAARLDEAEEAILAELSAGEDHFEVVRAEGFGDGFAEYLAEVGGDGEIAALV